MIATALDLVGPISRVADVLSEHEVVPSEARDLLSAATPALEAAVTLTPVLRQLTESEWTSLASTEAGTTLGLLGADVEALSESAAGIGAVTAEAAEIAVRGKADVVAIATEFLTRASALGPSVVTPPGQASLLALGADHLRRAIQVVERVQSELTVPTARLASLTETMVSTATTPSADAVTKAVSTEAPKSGDAPDGNTSADVTKAGKDPDGGADIGSPLAAKEPAGAGAATSGATDSQGTTIAGAAGGVEDGAAATASPAADGATAGVEGEGVEVELPDGSTAVAPNEQAAGAVRNALTQQGVPYVWGGTSPGVGLDCSGLTQWAYGQAGVELPRLAQEQGIGAQVSQEDLQPGDLAVWSGHVAMYIGNGQIIEAGNPVGVSGVRTDNIGMSFYGFYRPTA